MKVVTERPKGPWVMLSVDSALNLAIFLDDIGGQLPSRLRLSCEGVSKQLAEAAVACVLRTELREPSTAPPELFRRIARLSREKGLDPFLANQLDELADSRSNVPRV